MSERLDTALPGRREMLEAPVSRGKGEHRQPRQRSVLGQGDEIHHARRVPHPHVVDEPHQQHRRGSDIPHLFGRELDEVAEVFGEDGGDGAEGGGADDRQLGPAEQKCGKGAEALEEVGEDPAGTGHRRGQLGVGKGPEERDDATENPGEHDGSRLSQSAGDRGWDPEDAAPDRTADQDRDGTPESEAPGEPFPPVVRLG